jgi:predicted nucleic acid-binding protein
MIAVDSSVIIPWINGDEHPETKLLAALLTRSVATLAPATLAEILSDPNEGAATAEAVAGFELLDITEGYWGRAGRLRATLRKAGRKAGFADALIAQACIDADVPLLTRDRDFEAMVKLCGLKLHRK